MWHLIKKIMSNGYSAKVAINKFHQAYGYNICMTELIEKIMADKKRGGFPI